MTRVTRANYVALAATIARGKAAKVDWVSSGEVVSARVLAAKWGMTLLALSRAAACGEVFAIVIKHVQFYPSEFLDLNQNDISVVSRSLGKLTPTEKLVFWKRRHGVLGGKTVPQVLTENKGGSQLSLVEQLAKNWAGKST